MENRALIFSWDSIMMTFHRDLSVQGRARVVLKPTTKSPPFFGGVQFCFLNDISLEFDMGGVADICDWSFIRRKIRKAIIKDATEQIVYPNKIFVPNSVQIQFTERVYESLQRLM